MSRQTYTSNRYREPYASPYYYGTEAPDLYKEEYPAVRRRENRNDHRQTRKNSSGYASSDRRAARTAAARTRQANAARRNTQRAYQASMQRTLAQPAPVTAAGRQPLTRQSLTRQEQPQAVTRPQVQHANPLAVLMVIGIVAVMSLFLIQYLQLQTQVTNTVQEVASLQSQYSKLKQSNDEALSQLNSSINLDEIKYKAMTELGMTYPQEDQMVTYTNDDSDYVHQVQEVK